MSGIDRVFMGLGSNVGDRVTNLARAREALAEADGFTMTAASGIYETEPQGFADQPVFLNQVVAGIWTKDAPDLLTLCHRIERELGRERPFVNAPRTIDVDVLFWEHRAIHTNELVVPHPRLTERAFALWPLLELAPHLTDPTTGEPLRGHVTSELLTQGIRRCEGERAVV